MKMTMRTGPAFMIAALFSWGCSSSSNGDGDGGSAYQLTNRFFDSEAALVVVEVSSELPRELRFTTAQNDARLDWVLTPIDSGYYRITNVALGDSFSLDIISDGDIDGLRMRESSDAPGQRWLITPLNNGYCRFTTDFLGPDRSLDNTRDGNEHARPVMDDSSARFSQHWKIVVPEGNTDPNLALCDGVPG